jgi:hypothetical protein
MVWADAEKAVIAAAAITSLTRIFIFLPSVENKRTKSCAKRCKVTNYKVHQDRILSRAR